jgi:hypothetical protein
VRREAGHETEDWLQAEAELPSERIKPLAGETVKTTRKPMSEKRNEKCYAVEDQRFFGEDGYAEEGNKPGGGGKIATKSGKPTRLHLPLGKFAPRPGNSSPSRLKKAVTWLR